jgi:hypothetical protein
MLSCKTLPEMQPDRLENPLFRKRNSSEMPRNARFVMVVIAGPKMEGGISMNKSMKPLVYSSRSESEMRVRRMQECKLYHLMLVLPNTLYHQAVASPCLFIENLVYP